jgi:hypothetical protein
MSEQNPSRGGRHRKEEQDQRSSPDEGTPRTPRDTAPGRNRSPQEGSGLPNGSGQQAEEPLSDKRPARERPKKRSKLGYVVAGITGAIATAVVLSWGDDSDAQRITPGQGVNNDQLGNGGTGGGRSGTTLTDPRSGTNLKFEAGAQLGGVDGQWSAGGRLLPRGNRCVLQHWAAESRPLDRSGESAEITVTVARESGISTLVRTETVEPTSQDDLRTRVRDNFGEQFSKDGQPRVVDVSEGFDQPGIYTISVKTNGVEIFQLGAELDGNGNVRDYSLQTERVSRNPICAPNAVTGVDSSGINSGSSYNSPSRTSAEPRGLN